MSIKYTANNVITEFWKNGGPSFPHERENQVKLNIPVEMVAANEEPVCEEPEIYVDDVFLQDYGNDFGIPPHWAVKYYSMDEDWPVYRYFTTYDGAIEWACKHGWTV